MMRALSLPGTIMRNRRGRSNLPRFLTYIVTYKCNARCIMCDSWKIKGNDDMTLEEIEAVFRQLPVLDMVRLSGGEPFVRKDFPEIVELARRHLRPWYLHVTTNGFLTDFIVRFLEEREKKTPLYLLVSVDGLDEKHNQVRGVNNAWDRVTGTLKELAPRKDDLNITLAVNQTVVDEEGADHYLKLRDYLKPMGIQHNLVMAYDVSATYSTEREITLTPGDLGSFSTFGEFTKERILELMKEVERDIRGFPLADRMAKKYYLEGIRNRILESKADPNPSCVALGSHMRLLPDGTLPVCQFNSRIAGDLKLNSFLDVWKGEEAERQRTWVRNCPGCWAECEVLPNGLYSGDIFSRLFRRSS